MKTRLTLLLCLSLFVFNACSQNNNKTAAPAQTASTELLGPKEFDAAMKNNPGVLIDVRTASEQSKGMINGAIAMDIFADDFEARIDQLDKNKTYYVYCAAGGRSGEATEMMHKKGFKHVVDLDGGIKAWQQAGLPTK